MIVRMKKITVLVQSKDVGSTLNALGKAGVLHIEHENAPLSDTVTNLEEKYRSLLEAIEVLPDIDSQKDMAINLEDLVDTALRLNDEKEIMLEDLKNIKRDIELWKEWGSFDPELIGCLKNKGIWVRICKITKKETQDIPKGVILEELFRKGNIFYCAVISRQEIVLPFETLPLPEMALGEMFSELEQGEAKIKDIDKKLDELAGYKNTLFSYKKRLESVLEFNKILAGMGRFEKISYVKGYCPVYSISVLEKLAAREKWGLLIEDPVPEDNVPTLIKNTKLVEMIRPLFKIMNIIPGYHELDISLHFLIFFSLFFGMLIGDAGYGLVYILLAMFLQQRLKGFKDKSIFFLAYLLSGFAIAWGLITGVFFGHHTWLRPLVPYFSNDTNVQSFCFLLGATQLSIAHLWKFLRKWPSLKALSDAGWICILWTAYFLANSLILSKTFPLFGKWFFIIGGSLVILFTNPMRNIFKGIGLGIGDFLLKLMNSFGDIVSYIRLFAVGAAGVAIAGAFNQIVGSIGHSSILSSLIGLAVLFLGHTLNIVMGILAILVHGVRLNVLEFSGHLDIEWSGTEYDPFRAES
jgi:V/A-type H+-transporting ATPase subunit I